ncbi:hypothetical protein ACFCV8_18110 [Streptomyces sp. NPDC056347]|uniref:hypothetical protein n=1 Tax=Streptomyces sp. NPDC056347 TaxID=3345790 RepID=UPI0035D63162
MSSSNDQQHPYGQDPAHGNGNGPGPAYGGTGHDGRPYGDQSFGDQPYGDQSFGTDAYGNPQGHAQAQGQSWPGGYPQEPSAAHGAPDPAVAQTWEGQTWDTQYQPVIQSPQQAPHPQHQQQAPYPQSPQQAAYPQHQQQASHPQQGRPAAYPQPAEPTQYLQPVQPAQPAAYPQQPQQAQHPQAVPDAAETAYLPPVPPQGASGSYPLPPEVPVAQAAVPAAGPAAGVTAGGTDTSGPALDAAGYSTPTTVGNSRITDAQRARAEGRSPIIPPGMQPAGITAGLGLLLALGAALGSYTLVVPLVLLQGLTAAGWFRLNGMWPARQGIALAFAGGLVADVALLAAGRENGPAALLGTLGVWVLLTVVLQLRSHASADDRMQGLMATLASAALTVLAAGHLAAVPDAVTAGAVAVAAAVLVRALPLPGPVSVVAALLAAAGGGAVGGALTDLGTNGALIGLVAGGCALIGLRVASYDYPSRFVHMTAGVALPLTAAAPAVYLIGRMVA